MQKAPYAVTDLTLAPVKSCPTAGSGFPGRAKARNRPLDQRTVSIGPKCEHTFFSFFLHAGLFIPMLYRHRVLYSVCVLSFMKESPRSHRQSTVRKFVC